MSATLGLGTVQFGMPYGKADPRPQSAAAEVAAMVALAAQRGVGVLDTAAEYGDSEAAVGAALPKAHRFRIVTKSAKVGADVVDEETVEQMLDAVLRSLQRLNQARVYGLLIHRCADLFKDGGERLVDALEGLKAEGTIARWGVSVYDAADIDRTLERFRPDIVQLPMSALDRRLVDSGHLSALARADVEVHVRSVFLQGLLLRDPDRLPAAFAGARPMVEAFQASARAAGLSPLAAALAFARQQSGVDAVLVGAPSLGELDEILTAWDRAAAAAPIPALRDPSWSRWLDIRNWQHA